MKKVLKISSTIVIILVVLFAALAMVYFFLAKGNIDKAPSIFGYKPLTILSNSMQPAFNAGDIILIDVETEPKEGDVITYKHPDGVLVTHRAVRTFVQNGTMFFETKGDNNEHVDEVLISRENIVGVQEKIIPNLGYVAQFMAGPIGFFIFIVMPILAVIIIEIFQRLGLITTKKEEQIQG
ncbi:MULTISPECIES: signal peptidase I [Cytobacillus]|uniref:signal peptidase I n=1 Tax=Cytobacillus TaxID=2675230 RepID=UPI002040B919|nr:signal peptidase I [Cytobacillus firmus]MCM3707660.1 signal peptidase I [Cytobacillus firmus]